MNIIEVGGKQPPNPPPPPPRTKKEPPAPPAEAGGASRFSIVLDEAGWGCIVVERVNGPGRPVPVYRRIAAFSDREEGRLYAEMRNSADQ